MHIYVHCWHMQSRTAEYVDNQAFMIPLIQKKVLPSGVSLIDVKHVLDSHSNKHILKNNLIIKFCFKLF